MSEIVTITGALGSGKSVVGRAVAGLLGVPYFSTGDLQRELAARRGMTTLELNKLSETDPSIDHEIDGLMREFARGHSRCVLDSRLAWHFVPQSFKCYLQVNERIGAERIMGDTRRKSEKYESAAEAYQAVMGRQASEAKRFAALYDLDLSDMSQYDFVADTSLASPEAIAQKAVDCFKCWLEGQTFEKFWVSPRLLYPTRDRSGDDETGSIRAEMRGGYYLLAQGHRTASEALEHGLELVSFEPVCDVAGALRRDVIEQWERRHSFKFFAYPEG